MTNFLVPGRRVKWLSLYNQQIWFRGKILNIVGDKARIAADPDGKVLVISTNRLHALIR